MEPVIVHTSDLIAYRRCRRKWILGSYMGRNLEPVEPADPLWMGTCFHAALEDYHGYQQHDLVELFVKRMHTLPEGDRSPKFDYLVDVGVSMLEYYKLWLLDRDMPTTLWSDGRPQVEVKFSLPITSKVNYEGKLDRVAIDSLGRLWVVDYKTASRFNTSKLDNDFQVTAYTWAAQQLYGHPFEGVLYIQFLKEFIQDPQVLQNGHLSISRSTKTTYRHFFDRLCRHYEGSTKIPMNLYKSFLNYLAEQETEYSDKFIRMDRIRRNSWEIQAFENHVKAQIQEILDGPAIYPNPTSDCSWDCSFKAPCLAMDDGSDYEQLLQMNYRVRNNEQS